MPVGDDAALVAQEKCRAMKKVFGLEPLGHPRTGVQRLCAAGIAVAVATRVPGTRVTSGYGPGRALLDAGAVSAGGLRAAQARVLLMAALAAGTPAAELFAEWA